jgi:hypothetical protein
MTSQCAFQYQVLKEYITHQTDEKDRGEKTPNKTIIYWKPAAKDIK